MPKVGSKEFAYTPEGEEMAEDYAMDTGQEVEYPTYDAGGRVEKIQGYGEGGKVKPEDTSNLENLPLTYNPELTGDTRTEAEYYRDLRLKKELQLAKDIVKGKKYTKKRQKEYAPDKVHYRTIEDTKTSKVGKDVRDVVKGVKRALSEFEGETEYGKHWPAEKRDRKRKELKNK
jgi:hypothetical protein